MEIASLHGGLMFVSDVSQMPVSDVSPENTRDQCFPSSENGNAFHRGAPHSPIGSGLLHRCKTWRAVLSPHSTLHSPTRRPKLLRSHGFRVPFQPATQGEDSMNKPPAPSTSKSYGDVAEYSPSTGITEQDNGIPVHAPRDIHEDLAQRAQDEALEEQSEAGER